MPRDPNRYEVRFKGPLHYRAVDRYGLIEFDIEAWSAEDAAFQAWYELEEQFSLDEESSRHLFKIVSIRPWTPELSLSRQDERLRQQREDECLKSE